VAVVEDEAEGEENVGADGDGVVHPHVLLQLQNARLTHALLVVREDTMFVIVLKGVLEM
jgi:hypothetical protein